MKTLLLRALAALTLILTFSLALATPASAATVATSTAIAFTLPPQLLIGLLVSTVLPLLVGLVTKTVTHAGVKAILLAALAAATGILSELGATWASGGTYDLGTGLLTALGAFLVAVGLHYGLYKPTGASAALQRVGTSSTS